MRKGIVIAIVAAIALSVAAAPKKEKKEKKESETLHAVPLAQPAMYNGVMCRGTVFLDSKGRVRSCKLALDTVVAGHDFPRETVIRFDTAGRLMTAFLSKDARIQGHSLRGGGPEYATQFYPSGKLKSGFLAYDAPIEAARCRRAVEDGTLSGVEFYENGHLSHCEAAIEFLTDKCVFKRGDPVQIDTSGRLLCPTGRH